MVYDTEGEIDLSDYIVSDRNATATYQKTVWTDESGKSQYTGDGNKTYPVYVYEREGSSTLRYRDGGSEVSYFHPEPTKLSITFAEEEGNVTFAYARFVDTGELVLDQESTITKNGDSIEWTRECHVYTLSEAEQSLSGIEYADLIRLECDEMQATHSSFDGDAFVKSNTLKYKGVYAKDVGMLRATEEGCTKRTLNGEVYGKHICTKQEWKLINIVK